MAKDNFGQMVKGMEKGKGGIGKAVSAAAKAKAMPSQAMGAGKPDVDSKLLRTMPISESHLKQIKKAYGIK